MIDKRTIFEIHRLKDRGYSTRKIAGLLNVNRLTVKKYLQKPEQTFDKKSGRTSKLEPYRELVDKMLEKDPKVHAPVVLQRLKEQGFDGKITIVRNLLLKLRGQKKYRRAFIRFESPPGKQMQIDWGHFGSLEYEDTRRKLYALAVCESYSRMLYVEFTHSQNQMTLHRCLLNAFVFFGGSPQEIVVDNMATAVTERQGALVRFNGAFLDFLRVLKIVPKACNPGQPQEKGKVENAIRYLRQNFWPLRTFIDLADVQRQVLKWLDEVANVRIHQTLGQKPIDRFRDVRLSPLPKLLPDVCETASAKVHRDFAVRFDGNTYTAPPFTIGKNLTLKAAPETVTLYHREKRVAVHKRCWRRKQRIEIPSHKEQVRRLRRKLWQDKQIAAFSSLGQPAVDYLNALANANQPVKKNVSKMLGLKDEYGASAVLFAVNKALAFKAYGADYVENILYQEMTPRNHHQPVKLKNESLNRIRLVEPCLADYDAYIVKEQK